MEHPLDNPIWQALISKQAHLSEGDTLAKRFPCDIGPLAGMALQSPEAYHSLSKLSKPEEALVLFLDQPVAAPSKWTVTVTDKLTQMVCDKSLSRKTDFSIEPLSSTDISDMLALTRLTQPGPFRQRTITLGHYWGIRDSGRLVAMAGERLQLNEYTEISAVCTHPEFQGRGYAQALVTEVANQIIQRGSMPFLHTGVDNHRAIQVYERLGFQQRRLIHLAVLHQ